MVRPPIQEMTSHEMTSVALTALSPATAVMKLAKLEVSESTTDIVAVMTTRDYDSDANFFFTTSLLPPQFPYLGCTFILSL